MDNVRRKLGEKEKRENKLFFTKGKTDINNFIGRVAQLSLFRYTRSKEIFVINYD